GLLGIARERIAFLDGDLMGAFRLGDGGVIGAVGLLVVGLLLRFGDVGVGGVVGLGLRLLRLGVVFRCLIVCLGHVVGDGRLVRSPVAGRRAQHRDCTNSP